MFRRYRLLPPFCRRGGGGEFLFSLPLLPRTYPAFLASLNQRCRSPYQNAALVRQNTPALQAIISQVTISYVLAEFFSCHRSDRSVI